MEDSLLKAIWLLIVGMGSVFFILFLIGLIGKLLIRWVNTFPEEESFAKHLSKSNKNKMAAKQLAVITSVVEELTQGAGYIENIQKIEP